MDNPPGIQKNITYRHTVLAIIGFVVNQLLPLIELLYYTPITFASVMLHSTFILENKTY
jgi:hypothetical protein